jgi:hypothetical protein
LVFGSRGRFRAFSVAPGSWLWILSALLITERAEAGAWLQPYRTAYLRITSGYLVSDERFDEHGDRVPWDASLRDAEYHDMNISAYGEVGVVRGWNAIFWTEWKHLEAQQPSAVFTTYGLGDVALGVKRSFFSSMSTVFSGVAGIGFPTGYDVNEYPALGAGSTEGIVQAQLGHSWGGPWTNLETEFRVRGRDYADQLRGAFGGGWSMFRRIGVRGEARGALSLGVPDSSGTSDAFFNPETQNPSYLDLAGTVSVAIGHGVAIEGEVRSTVMGENALAGTRWTLALATNPVWTLWK